MCKLCGNGEKKMGITRGVIWKLSPTHYLVSIPTRLFHQIIHMVSQAFPLLPRALHYLLFPDFSTFYTPPTITTTYFINN